MGLLDQILGGLAGNVGGRQAPAASSGGGMGNVMLALLPVVLSMLANRQGSAGAPGMGGGMGGMGGLGGLLEQLTRSGYGAQASSWVGTGANQPLPAQAWSDVFAPDQLAAMAAQAGVTEDEARSGLSELMPEVVDRLTPEGSMPAQDQLLASIDDFVARLR
jgi:uncharacterized protein YidB (DUF937 family)